MDEKEPMPVVTAQSPAPIPGPNDTGSAFLDWFLFGLTLIGAGIVYVSMFMSSAIGFVVGEAVCLSIALAGIAIKYRHKLHEAAERIAKGFKS